MCVHTIAELHPGLLTACFDMFTNVVEKYEEHKQRAEEMKKWEANKKKKLNCNADTAI